VRNATDTFPPELVARVLRDRQDGGPRPALASAPRSQRDLIIASLIACPARATSGGVQRMRP
jgi:hypothetical protein